MRRALARPAAVRIPAPCGLRAVAAGRGRGAHAQERALCAARGLAERGEAQRRRRGRQGLGHAPGRARRRGAPRGATRGSATTVGPRRRATAQRCAARPPRGALFVFIGARARATVGGVLGVRVAVLPAGAGLFVEHLLVDRRPQRPVEVLVHGPGLLGRVGTLQQLDLEEGLHGDGQEHVDREDLRRQEEVDDEGDRPAASGVGHAHHIGEGLVGAEHYLGERGPPIAVVPDVGAPDGVREEGSAHEQRDEDESEAHEHPDRPREQLEQTECRRAKPQQRGKPYNEDEQQTSLDDSGHIIR
mmetsp:Transcript_30339/g.84619  ORF Transcript_30339/g.84619 Transcript_30339/m.84619 type:complete len:302 (-) Transcript_30339:413-1318(-)